jgi:hypothetical protein
VRFDISFTFCRAALWATHVSAFCTRGVDLDHDLATAAGDHHLRTRSDGALCGTDADCSETFFDLVSGDQLIAKLIVRNFIELTISASEDSHNIILVFGLVWFRWFADSQVVGKQGPTNWFLFNEARARSW